MFALARCTLFVYLAGVSRSVYAAYRRYGGNYDSGYNRHTRSVIRLSLSLTESASTIRVFRPLIRRTHQLSNADAPHNLRAQRQKLQLLSTPAAVFITDASVERLMGEIIAAHFNLFERFTA